MQRQLLDLTGSRLYCLKYVRAMFCPESRDSFIPETLATSDCQVIGAREQSDTLQVGGGSFGLHNCLFCRLPICQTCGTYLLCLILVCIIHEPWSKCSKKQLGRSGQMVHNMHGALLNDRVPLKGYLSSASQVVIVQQQLLFGVWEKEVSEAINQYIVSGDFKQNLANRNNDNE